MIETTSPETIAAIQRGMAQRPDMTGHLSGFDVPSLAVCGSEDMITTSDEMSKMAKAMPQCQFVSIEGAGHLAPMENPAAVNKAIEKFVA